jgi:hypothetical protein
MLSIDPEINEGLSRQDPIRARDERRRQVEAYALSGTLVDNQIG